MKSLVMFPILIFVYSRLALREERDAVARFGDEYTRYASVTPRFVPRLAGKHSRRGPEEPKKQGDLYIYKED